LADDTVEGARASALVYGIDMILTFNGDDFRRYAGIKVLHPRDLIQNITE
jgi:hypothetical protein